MKYKELVKLIENISLHIPNINSFYIGDVYEINSDPTVKYSTVVLTNQESTFSVTNEQYTYNFVLFYIDRLLDDEKNRLDIQSHAIDALSNILEILGNSYNCIIDNYRFEVFQERFADLCSGAFARVSVVVDEVDCIESFKIISENDLKSIAINQNGEYNGLFNKVIVDVPAPYYRTKHLEATENHKLYIASDEDIDGYESVNVNVPEPNIEENRIVIELANGSYKIAPTDGHDAMKEVTLTVAVPNPALTNLSVTENGTYEAVDSGYYGFASVSVDVPQPTYNSGELVANANGAYRASDNGYDGYYAVIVDVPQTSGSTKWVLPDKTSFNGSPMNTFDASGVDTSNLTTMYYMFAGCDGLTELDLSSWDTSNVKYMEHTFYDCGFLSKLNVNFNTSSVTTMQYTFSMLPRLTSIDLSTWDTSKVWDMRYMFYESSKLNAINGITNWNTSAVTTTAQMFAYCGSNLSLNLSGWNVSKVTDFNHMFFYSGIVSVNISNWRFKDSANVNSMFGYCGSLTTIITNENTVLPDVERLSLGLENTSNVTAESFANLFRALPISTHNGTFTIGSTNLSKLSDAQKAIATSKGWTLA